MHLHINFGNGFRQEVPNGDTFDLILQECAVTPSNPELHSTSWYESVMWTTQDQKQRKITIHFVKHDEMLLYPEDTLLMIEGKINKIQIYCFLWHSVHSGCIYINN